MSDAMGAGVTLAIVGVWLFFILIALASTVFWIVELVDVIRREFADPNMKIVWILVIVLGHFIGSLIYFFVGRQQGTIPAARTY